MSKADLLSRGTLLFDPATATVTGWPGVNPATSGFPAEGPSRACLVQKRNGNDGYARMEIPLTNIGLASADWKGLVFEVYNPNPHPVSYQLRLYNNAEVTLITCNVAVDVGAGWQLCHMPRANFTHNNFTSIVGDVTNSIRYARITLFTTDTTSGWPTLPNDAKLYIGRIYYNPVQVPVFLLSTDDGRQANVIGTGGPSTGSTYKAICDHYGFRATVYIVPSWIGTPDFCTLDHLKYLRDAGWTVGTHSYSHPQRSSGNPSNPGLRLFGPLGVAEGFVGVGGRLPSNDDSTIYQDIVDGVDAMISDFPDARHFALPQGGWDGYVQSACARAGLLSVRGISGINIGGLVTGYQLRGCKHVGVQNGGSFTHTGWMDLPGAIQLDGSLGSADILAYYTEGKRVGATMGCYTHSSNGLVNFDYLCSLLRADQDAGLIRVMNVAEYYDQVYDFGGRALFDNASFTPPLAFATSDVGTVKRVITFTGSPSASVINKQVEFGER